MLTSWRMKRTKELITQNPYYDNNIKGMYVYLNGFAFYLNLEMTTTYFENHIVLTQ